MLRYFNCTPLYGLFAPVSKVAAAPASVPAGGSTTASATFPSRSQVAPALTSVRRATHPVPVSSSVSQLHERSGSRESLSSVSSVTSSASRSRVRLAVTSISRQVVVC